MYFLSLMSLREFVLIDTSSKSSYVDDSLIESKIESYSATLCSFSTKFPSSNCAKVIMSPVCSWDDAVYGIYDTDGHVASASEYGCDMYDHVLEKVFPNTTSCEETIFCVLGT